MTDSDSKAIGLSFWDFVAVGGYFTAILAVGLCVSLSFLTFAICCVTRGPYFFVSQSLLRPNRDTVSGFFLAGRHMFWLPVNRILSA